MNPDASLYLASAIFAVAAALAGVFVILKRMALVADVMSHVALPGFALGLAYHFNPFLGALATLALGAVAVISLEEKTSFAAETVVGIVFIFALALGALMTPEEELLEALFGSIEKFGPADFWLLVAGSIAVIGAVLAFWRGFARTMFSVDIAQSERVPVAALRRLYWAVLVLVIALGIKIVGTLLMGALLVLPAASAKNVARSLRAMAVLSAVIGAAIVIGGLTLSRYSGFPPGPVVILSGIFVFVLSLFAARR